MEQELLTLPEHTSSSPVFLSLCCSIFNSHKFYHYQQIEQSPLISLNTKRPRHIALEIQVLTWDMYTNMADLNLLMGSRNPQTHVTLKWLVHFWMKRELCFCTCMNIIQLLLNYFRVSGYGIELNNLFKIWNLSTHKPK